ncbi:MAG: tetratricopeptide repeat protein [Oligoflexales bacterium]
MTKISPSQFMRELRPENYSDTEDRVAYLLDAPSLEYHLDSITSRNQTQDFEIFCRKLCERTICPNLRAHTGPDGGGDSKVDTETYPVAEEIAALFYIGEARAAQERWAFAFSAKEDWKTKVKDDVKKVSETGRDYKKIFFVTSQFAKDKDRADLEDTLSNEYSIPVTIHDRSWIVKEIIENDRKDIAYNYLKIGEQKNDPFRLGPKDYSRTQQLADIEQSMNEPDSFKGMEQQRVTEALLAATLSRNMERPRTETDGRFLRAIRLAEADGTYRQKLEVKYEHIWTAFWWFDDYQFLKDSYEAIETLALQSDQATNLELLCNLLQLFVNSIVHDHLSREECKFEERTAKLKAALEKLAEDKDRPNNALEAQTSLLIMRMNQALLDDKHEELSNIWNDFSVALEKANGLGEFKADRLVKMVEVAGNIAGNDPAYNDLVEKTAEFVSSRKSEAEGALILLARAKKLDFDNNFEMIRLLGKAAIGLTKKEYADQLIEALQLLMLAYRSAGLLWAARASCAFLAASLVMEGEENSELPVSFVPTMGICAWIALELGHIPDFLLAIQLLNGALATLPLTDNSKEKVGKNIQELDMALGSLFLNLDENELRKLENLPDILDALGLFMARSSLLYTLGHVNVLREDGSLPESESDEDVHRIFSMLASQPVAQNLNRPLVLNAEGPQTLSTGILGMTIDIHISGSIHSVLIAEAVLGSLEAFFATAIGQRIMPHTEKLQLNVVESAEVSKPSFELSAMDMTGTIIWPAELSPNNFENQGTIYKFWAEVSGDVLATCCVIEEVKKFLEKLYADEAVHHRMTMVTLASNSYHRVASRYISQISDWQDAIQQSYELNGERPALTLIPFVEEKALEDYDIKSPSGRPPLPRNHKAYSVRSVLDIHAWDQAQWRGTAYAQYGPDQPPYMAFLYENEECGRKIFERWQERFGTQDENEEISLSIIRQLPGQNKHHYCILITSRLPESSDFKPNQIVTMASRSITMTPDSDINLDRFLSSYKQSASFYLAPAVLSNNGSPEILTELAILKHNLNIKLAAELTKDDIEFMVLALHSRN